MIPFLYLIVIFFETFRDGGPTNRRNVDDLIFDMFREKDDEVAVVGTFLAVSLELVLKLSL
jgi:hypothetical protein